MNYLPLIAFLVIIVLFVVYAGRARRKQQAVQAAMVERIEAGTRVMTTSGLHGTVVAKNPDNTVILSIAPGVEVTWEVAALRDAAALPRELGGIAGPGAGPGADPEDHDRTEADRGSIDLHKDDSDNRGDMR